MGANKKTPPLTEEQDTEYVYCCGGIQPIVIPEEPESEEDA